MKKQFKLVKELNPENHPSTGQVICYYGKSPWKRVKAPYVYLQINDCQGSVRLHLTNLDNLGDFICKLKKLRNALDKFIFFLEKR